MMITMWEGWQAFKRAWALACTTPSAIVYVPAQGKFSLRPSVFAGPCAPNLLLQVHVNLCSAMSRVSVSAS